MTTLYFLGLFANALMGWWLRGRWEALIKTVKPGDSIW